MTDSNLAHASGADAEATNETPVETTLNLQFLDFGADPIAGIDYKIAYIDGKEIGGGVSDGEGKSPSYGGLEADKEIGVWVKRDADGQYKNIGTTRLHAGNQTLTCISPKIKIEGETQSVEGAKGEAHELQPPVPPTVEEIRASDVAATATPPAQAASPSAASGTYTVAAGDYPGKIAAKFGMSTAQFLALNPQIKDVTKMKVGDTVNISGMPAASSTAATASSAPITKGKSAQATITKGRDTDGLPMAVYVKEAKDWFGRTIQSVYNFWTSLDFQSKGSKKATVAHEMVNPLIKTSENSSESIKLLNSLIDFEEKQVKVAYTETTIGVLKRYQDGKTDWSEKVFNTSLGKCLVYVKVALKMSGYTNGVSGTIPAKNSGPDWISFGFNDVTGTLPKVDIEMKNGDVVKQPDIVYTCPGDVIVYERYGTNEYGHIDIRTYHGFMSDFAWGPARSGLPDQSTYKVIGVYRKYSDTMAMARLQAFLRIVRERETTGHPDPYHALHSDKAGVFLTFKDESEYPGATAGAYQIQPVTYVDLTKISGRSVPYWPKDFSPATQDRLAIYLMQQQSKSSGHPRRSALGYILQGEIEKALDEANLKGKWVSLPGGSQSRDFTLNQLKDKFEQYIHEFKNQ